MKSKWRGIVVAIACIVVVGLPAEAQPPVVQPGLGITGKVLLHTTTTEAGQPLQFPLFRNQVTVVRFEVDPGRTTGVTRIQFPAVEYVMEGSVSVERDGQPPRTISADQAVALPVNFPLALVNRGTVPTKFLIVFFGEAGKPNTVPQSGVTPGARATVMLNTTKDMIGEPILFPVFANQFDARIANFAPGAVNPRHTHSHIAFVYVLEGVFTLKVDGLPPKTFLQGDLGVEPIVAHAGTNAATTLMRFLVIFVGDVATPPLTYLPQQP